MLFPQLIRRVFSKSQKWNQVLRNHPAKVEKSSSSPVQPHKDRSALKIRPLLNSKYMETSEMTCHSEPRSFNISPPNTLPDEINLQLKDFNYQFEEIENSKFMNVAIVGPVNAGKSSLLNCIIGKDVSAVSSKRNTTFENLEGILSSLELKSQIVFSDVPGFSRMSNSKNGETLKQQANLRDQNKIMLVVDGNIRPKESWVQDILYLKALSDSGIPVVLVVNKMDLIFNKRRLADTIEMFENYLNFEKVFMVSCTTGFGVDELTRYLHENNTPGTWLYPEGVSSAYSELEIMYEIIKSALFDRLYQEIPYLLKYQIREFHVKSSHIKMLIQVNVEKRYQIAMVLGKKGNNMRAIREDIQTRLAKLYNREIEIGLILGVGNLNPVDVKVLKGDEIYNAEESIKFAKYSMKNKIPIPKKFN